jgi:hypothetical protein
MLSNYGFVQSFFTTLITNDLLLIVFSVLLWGEVGAERFVDKIPQIVNAGLS